MRRSPAVRVWRELGPWVAAMVVGACADKALPPTGARSSVLSLRVRANVASQVGAATRLLSVHVGYKRPTSDTLISLATQEAQVTAGGTQQLSLSVDVSRCLADPARGGAGSVCPLQFAFSLLDANRVLLDSVDVGPINATPGVGSTAPLTVDLGNVATIAVTPDTGTVTAGGTVQVAGTARDAAGKVLAGRAIVYASSDTTIATVSRSGVVTTRTVGALTITASVGATAGVAQINVSPLVSSSLAASEFFTCALNVVGAAYCWGSDTFGQLGDGRSSASSVPVPVAGSLTFTQISAGGMTGCGVTAQRSLYCWGGGAQGQLGSGVSGTGALSRVPVRVSGAQLFRAVAVGYLSTCGLTVDGAAYCWGSNKDGRLGTGDTVSASVPVPVSGGLRFQSISAGLLYACGVANDSAAYCWGRNLGQVLGVIGAPIRSLVPVPVTGGLTFSQLRAGTLTTCGVASGASYCWGGNEFGSAGNGSINSPEQPVPAAVVGAAVFSSVKQAAGNDIRESACGLATDGTAFCWGSNPSGQLGTTATLASCELGGTTFGCTGTPTAVSTSAKFLVVEPGREQVCGITTTHTLLCWGENSSGQLGDGTTTNRDTPTAVSGGLRLP